MCLATDILFATSWQMLEPVVRHLEGDLRSCQYLLDNQGWSFDEFLDIESQRTIAQIHFRNLRDAELSR